MTQQPRPDVLQAIHQEDDSSPASAEPAAVLRRMITGFFSTCLIYVAAQFRVADHLVAGPRTVAELAVCTQTLVEPLRRVLRGLSAIGLLSEPRDDIFELTDLGACLRSDAPGQQRTWAMLWGHEMFPRAWGNLAHTLKTGEVPFDQVFGQPFFDYVAEHDDLGEMFNTAMSTRSRREHDAVLATYDFGNYKHIVDVGGGTGGLLTAICARCPSSEGVVFDLPFAQAGAEETFRAAGLDARCRFIAGNFFETTPPAGDLVVLSRVLHDWDDERALLILRNCERAMEPDGRLLVVDQLMTSAPNRRADAVMADLQMLATLRGRERTEREFAELFAAARLRLQQATATNTPVWLLEAVRA